jgi:hypothetical protein
MACRVAVQAFAAAIIGLDPVAQNLLITSIATALEDIAKNTSCDNAAAILGFIQATIDPATAIPAVSPDQMKSLCSGLVSCPLACTAVMG